jgi:hypothetical protein
LDDVAVELVGVVGMVAAAGVVGVLGALGVVTPVIELGGVAGMVMVSGSEALACMAVLVGVALGAVYPAACTMPVGELRPEEPDEGT